jgi:hypothetical protein
MLLTDTVPQAFSTGPYATPALLGHRFASFFIAMMPNLEFLADEGYYTAFKMHRLLLDSLLALDRLAPNEEGAGGRCAAGLLTVLCDLKLAHKEGKINRGAGLLLVRCPR